MCPVAFTVFSISLTLKTLLLIKGDMLGPPLPTCPFSPPVWTPMSIPTLPRMAKRRRTAPRKSVSSTTKMPSWRRVKWWWPLPLPPPLSPVPPPLSSRVIITSTFLNDTFWVFRLNFLFPVLIFLFFPLFLDEVFHNLGKEDHRHPTPVAPRNSPTSLTSLPPLNGISHPPSPNTHLPSIGTQSFPRL